MTEQEIIATVRTCYPDVQVVYLFGSYGTETETAESDLDLALLLPRNEAEEAGSPLLLNDCRFTLSKELSRPVDLINIRLADTVFQNEILRTGRILYCQDDLARQNFEMLVLSFYQKLQDERRGILEQIRTSKRVYNV